MCSRLQPHVLEAAAPRARLQPSSPLCAVAVIASTSASAGALCQGLVLVEFLMVSTRVASVTEQLARVRRVINISMISYISLSSLLLIMRVAGFRALDLGRWGTGGSTPWAVLNTIALASVGVLVLYASHKIAARHRKREARASWLSHPSAATCPPARLPACPPAQLPTCPPAHLPTCPASCLPACPLA